MAVVLLPTPPFWFTMATIVLTAGILARRLSALLSERLAVFWPRCPTGADTGMGSPGSFRVLLGFAPSHRPRVAGAPSYSPPPSPRARQPPCCPLQAPLVPTDLSWRWHNHRSRGAAHSIPRPLITGLLPCKSRHHMRRDALPLCRDPPPSYSRLLRPLGRGRLPRAAKNRPSCRSILRGSWQDRASESLSGCREGHHHFPRRPNARHER